MGDQGEMNLDRDRGGWVRCDEGWGD